MAIWLTATKRPGRCAGAISAIYIGVDIEATPMPNPPKKRKMTKNGIEGATAVPIAEIKNRIAARNNAFLRPKRSETGPTIRTPNAQPINTQPETQQVKG